MLLRHLSMIARQLLFFAFTFFSIVLHATPPCSPTITYEEIPGYHTERLGTASQEISQIAEALASSDSKYCNMSIHIQFVGPFSSRQLVYKNPSTNQHFFEVFYQAPSYKVMIRNSNGLLIEDKVFSEDWARYVYPEGLPFSSKEALYQRWNDQRENIYTQLEESYNQYDDLKTFLYSLMPAEPAVAVTEPPSAPPVAPSAPQVETAPIQPETPQKDIVENIQKPSQKTLVPSATEVTKKNATPSRSTPQSNKRGKSKSQTTDTQNQDQNYTPTRSVKTSSANKQKTVNSSEPLLEFITFSFCTQYRYSVYNGAKYSCRISIGHEGEEAYQVFDLGSGRTKLLRNKLKPGDWYAVTYPKVQQEKDIRWRLLRVEKSVEEIANAKIASAAGQLFFEMIPDQVVTTKYDPFGNKVSTNIDDNQFEKEFGKIMMDYANKALVARVKMDTKKHLADIELSKNIYNHYESFINNNPPQHSIEDKPNFIPHSKKKMTPLIGINFSVGTINYDRDEGFHRFWEPTANFSGALELGLPFETVSGGYRPSFFRPYLMVGYQLVRFKLLEEQNYFVGEDYVAGGQVNTQYALNNKTGIKAERGNVQAGLLFKFMTEETMFTLGGGVQRQYHSRLTFDKKVDYFSNVDLTLSANKFNNVLEENNVSPFFLARWGFFPNKRCPKKLRGISFQLEALFAKVQFVENSNYQLYEQPFDPITTNPAVVDFLFDKKWYFQWGISMGYHF